MSLTHCFDNSLLFEGFSKKGREFFIAGMAKKRYSAGEAVFSAGDPGVGLYLLTEGSLEIILPLSTGKEEILATLEPGDHFGDITFLVGGDHLSSVIAKEDSEIMILSRTDFMRLQKEKPQTCLKLLHRTIHIFSQRLRKQQPLFEMMVIAAGELKSQ